jgi:integrase/recombinase XerD
MKHISKKIAKEYMLYISNSSSVGSYNQRLFLFKRLWELLKDEGRYEINVFKDFKKMKVEKSSKRAFTTEELFKILDYIKDDLDMLCLFSIGIYTGLRLGDSACLKWSNVDLIKRTISIVPQKVKRFLKEPIVIPIHHSLYNILMNIRENKKSDEFVLPEIRKSYETKYLKIKILKIFRDCGIQTYEMVNGRKKFLCGFHSLRHSFVSLNINGGMSSLLVQKIVGHSSVSMTSGYLHSNHIAISEGLNKNIPDFIECKDYVVMSFKDSDVELLKELYDKEKDSNLSDTLKRVIEYYKTHNNIINVT